jgi:O-antigen/teichoic acid export membrane protein
MCVTGLNNLFQPRTIRELQHSGIRGMIVSMLESIAVVIGILSVISIGFYFFGGMALDRIFGSAYAEYGHVAFILSLSTLAVSLAILFGNGLAALGNSKEYFLGEFSCCVVSVTAALVSIPWYGLDGAAASLALGGLAASLVTGWTLYRAIARFRPQVAERSTTVEDTKLEHAATSSSSASTPAITN